jgi:sugar/nucleoside kinase (ribokinase family)
MKMNAAELATFTGRAGPFTLDEVKRQAADQARRTGRDVFVTMAERGLMGATPTGRVEHVAALPLRGPIDVVGAGDSVTANLAASLAAGADLRDALRIAAVASSLVIHQLGTTGTANPGQIAELLAPT